MSVLIGNHEFVPLRRLEEISSRAGVYFVTYSGSRRGLVLEIGHGRILRECLRKWAATTLTMRSAEIVVFVHYTPKASPNERMRIAQETRAQLLLLMPQEKQAG